MRSNTSLHVGLCHAERTQNLWHGVCSHAATKEICEDAELSSFCLQVQSQLDNLVGKRMDTLGTEYTIEICK